jgi:hypothetical protein
VSVSVWILIISLGAMIGAGAVGSWPRDRLPEHHLTDQSAGIIEAGVGLISTLAGAHPLDQLPNTTDQQRKLRKQIDEILSRSAQERMAPVLEVW